MEDTPLREALSAEPFDHARPEQACEPAELAESVDAAPVEESDAPVVHPAPSAGGSACDLAPESVIEALLFASDAPLSVNRLAELTGCGNITQVRLHIAALNDKYRDARLSFRIEEIARGYRMLTLPQYRPWLAKLARQRAETRLGDAALETLAIIAYKQPIIRADIDAIRGVSCGDVIGRLRDMGLVRVVGRAEVVGRPMLYGTTRKFLDLFGLADTDDLPPLEALKLRPRPAAEAPATSAEQPPPAARAAAGA